MGADGGIRIVVAGQVPPPLGGQNVMIARQLELLAHEDDLTVDHLEFHFTPTWATVRRMALSKALEYLRVAGRLLRFRWRGRIDCLLYPVGGPQVVPLVRDVLLLPLCHLLTRRVVLHFHAGGIADTIDQMPRLLARAARLAYSRSAAAVVLTDFGRRDPEALGVRRVVVIPNTLPDAFDGGACTSDGSTLLYLGHISEPKGVPPLLRAFASLRKTFTDVRLVVAGEALPPFSEAQLADLVAELGLEQLVLMPGVITGDAKWAAYRSADLFVFPSRAPESMPLVVLEAMMWGLPIVATRWRGIPEILGKEPGGLLVDPGPDFEVHLASGLAEALRQRDRWAEWGSRNRRRYLEMMSFPQGYPLPTFLKEIARSGKPG